MKTTLDCMPCFVRQAVEAARRTSREPAIQERIVREVLHWTGSLDLDQPIPAMAQRIHRRLRELTGVVDPYRDIKDRQNRMALALMPQLRRTLAGAVDPLMLAVRLAIAGNVIDLGVHGRVSSERIRQAVDHALTAPFDEDGDRFRTTAAAARRILYLTDNAGEIAFDRLLIEQLGPKRVTVAVRGRPVINDATRVDARAVGLTEMVTVVDNGSDAPGTLLAECSAEFLRHYRAADLIIAKGQGNFEALSDEAAPILFLLVAKCPVVAAHTGAKVGTHLIRRAQAAAG